MSIGSSFACDVGKDELVMRLVSGRFNERRFGSVKGLTIKWPNQSEVTQESYNALIARVQNFYSPVFAKSGFQFKVESFWNSDDENAFAGFDSAKKLKTVVVNGGYARRKYMTDDAFLSVICHEVGHHLGGFPKKHFAPWASVEGQADYFSTLRCMKDILKNDPKNVFAEKLKLPKVIKDKCRAQYAADDEYQICLRSAQASLDYGKVLVEIDYRGMNMDVSLTTPSVETRQVIKWDHPSPQCRVDTKLNGALCNNLGALSDTDEFLGTCNSSLGVRPNCWYVPGKSVLIK